LEQRPLNARTCSTIGCTGWASPRRAPRRSHGRIPFELVECARRCAAAVRAEMSAINDTFADGAPRSGRPPGLE
jgi:hypothetical protein